MPTRKIKNGDITLGFQDGSENGDGKNMILQHNTGDPIFGGNICFQPGKGVNGGKDGAVILALNNGTEVVKFTDEGTFISGEKMSDNRQTYDAVLRWLCSGVHHE